MYHIFSFTRIGNVRLLEGFEIGGEGAIKELLFSLRRRFGRRQEFLTTWRSVVPQASAHEIHLSRTICTRSLRKVESASLLTCVQASADIDFSAIEPGPIPNHVIDATNGVTGARDNLDCIGLALAVGSNHAAGRRCVGSAAAA